MELKWDDGFAIAATVNGDEVTISANREGLRSLARHLAALADEPPGAHIHLDEHNSLDNGSSELIIEHRQEVSVG